MATRVGPGGALTVANQRDAFGPAFFTESIRFKTGKGGIRLSLGYVAMMEDGREHPTVILEHYSAGLLSAVANEPALETSESYRWPTAGAGVAAKLSSRLRQRWSDLAAAMEELATDETKLGALGSSLQRLTATSAASAERDAVLLGVDLVMASLPSEAYQRLDRLRPVLGRLGVPLAYTHRDEGGRQYARTVAMAVAHRAGKSRWTDQAFLVSQQLGWESAFADSLPDTFEPVIERGERFLRGHRASLVWLEVAWTVARAHETAWSLNKAQPGKEYAEEAPRHRERALELYRTILEQTTDSRLSHRLRRRIRRIELDVDTGCREYAAPDPC